jgi:hypothetical protein
MPIAAETGVSLQHIQQLRPEHLSMQPTSRHAGLQQRQPLRLHEGNRTTQIDIGFGAGLGWQCGDRHQSLVVPGPHQH